MACKKGSPKKMACGGKVVKKACGGAVKKAKGGSVKGKKPAFCKGDGC